MGVPIREIVKLKAKFPMITRHVDAILIEGLSKTQRKVYNWMVDGKEIDTQTVNLRHDIIQTTACEALRDLFRMGLIHRKQVTTGPCRKFIYWKGTK